MKYEQIMDKIEVTPEMRQRVLRNVEAGQAKQKKRQLTRRLVTLAACLAIVVCCCYVWKPKQTDPPEQGMMAVSQIDTVDSLEALTEKTGIPMNELTGVPLRWSARNMCPIGTNWRKSSISVAVTACATANPPERRTIPATTMCTRRRKHWKSPETP